MAEAGNGSGEREDRMHLRCGEMMAGCAAVIRGASEEDVLQKAAEHARQEHDVEALSEEQIRDVRSRIRPG